MTTTSTRPAAGTRAATVHQRVHQLRHAASDLVHPGQALAMVRRMSEDQAKAALIVAVISERWSPAERAAMALPPAPDFDAIAAENKRLQDEYRRHATAAQDTDVTFDERNAS